MSITNFTKLVLLIATSILGFSHPIFAASDLENAMNNSNNWAHQRGQYNNQGYIVRLLKSTPKISKT